MNRNEEAKAAVLRRLRELAPEIDPAAIPPDVPLRDEVELDSYDFLRLVVRASGDLGVEVSEADVARCATLAGLVDVLLTSPPARPAAGVPR